VSNRPVGDLYQPRSRKRGFNIYFNQKPFVYVTVGTVLSVTLLSQKNEGQESFFLCMHYAIKNTGTKIEESTVCIVVITVAGIIDITN